MLSPIIKFLLVVMTWKRNVKFLDHFIQLILLAVFIYSLVNAILKLQKREIGSSISYEENSNLPFPSIAFIKSFSYLKDFSFTDRFENVENVEDFFVNATLYFSENKRMYCTVAVLTDSNA